MYDDDYIIIIEKGIRFLEEKLGKCLENGFVLMNKTDFESLLLPSLILEDLEYKIEYEISRLEKVYFTEVEKLRYVSDLTYNEDIDLIRYLLLEETLKNITLYENKDKIKISLTNQSIKEFLQDYLLIDEKVEAGSFNENIVLITFNDLVYSSFPCAKGEWDKILERVLKTIILKFLYKID